MLDQGAGRGPGFVRDDGTGQHAGDLLVALGSVETLAGLAGLSVANASQHLQHLRRAGLVTARKQDRHVFYAIAGETVLSLLIALRRTAEENFAEMGRLIEGYLLARDSLEPVSRQEDPPATAAAASSGTDQGDPVRLL